MNIIGWLDSDDEEREEFLEGEVDASDPPRFNEREAERLGVEDVPLTMYERGVTAQALKNEIDHWEEQMQEGRTRVPERISILRNALGSLEGFDGTESWGPARCEVEDEE